MAADSLTRKLLKNMLVPVLNDRTYRYVQCAAMAWDIRSGNSYETEIDLLPYLVYAGDSVLDIGANYGLYSYHMSKLVGEHGHIFAFEPVPFTALTFKLIAKVLRFRHVELIPQGCSDKNEKVTFTLSVQTNGAIAAGLAHLHGRDDERAGKEKWGRYAGTKDVECEVVRVDDVIPALTNVSFIKCDIEGAELLAFRGAKKTIERGVYFSWGRGGHSSENAIRFGIP